MTRQSAEPDALYSDDDERPWRKIDPRSTGASLTGALDTPRCSRAIRLAWQADGVTEVINEIEVVKSDGISGFGRDTWIATQSSPSCFSMKVSSINYSHTVAAKFT